MSLSSINSGYTKRLPFGSPLVRPRPLLVLGYSRKKSSSVRSIEKEVEKVDNTVAKEEAEEIVADGQSNINSTKHNVPPKKLKVAIKTRLIELTNEIERIQKPLRPSSRVKITSEWLHPSSSEADEFADTPVEEVNRRRKVREAKEIIERSSQLKRRNNNIGNDNNTASTSDIFDEFGGTDNDDTTLDLHDTVNDNDSHTVVPDNDHAPALALPDVDTDNENNPPSTANRLAGETRNVRASTRGVSRPHYTEPSLKSKLRREDVENASSACNVPQPIPQSISTRGSRVGRKARSTTTCYKEPSSKTKLRREP